jgi:hypothetical protein
VCCVLPRPKAHQPHRLVSYNVAIVLPPVPPSDAEAWAALPDAIDATGPIPPVFTELLSRLTARYRCICDLPDDEVDEGVWSDGPLRNNLGHRASVLGMVNSRVHEVLPFLIEEASSLGLVVFDWATETIHRPGLPQPGRAARAASAREGWRLLAGLTEPRASSSMTADDAARIAGVKARQLNLPWGPDVRATRRRLWPLPGTWRVVSRVPGELAETTIVVNERSGEALPRGVRYSRSFGNTTG